MILPSLGIYKILIDEREIYMEELTPLIIVDNYTYFEKETVPYVLEKMGFTTILIGGKNQPDIIAYHKRINPQKINVEPTLTNEYKLSDFDEDKGKYGRYIRTYNFKRLLTVCHTRNITQDVIDELAVIREPVSLIEYKDLYTLQIRTKNPIDEVASYGILNTTGKITVVDAVEEPVIFFPTRINVKRHL